jgi:hypothetical protein
MEKRNARRDGQTHGAASARRSSRSAGPDRRRPVRARLALAAPGGSIGSFVLV